MSGKEKIKVFISYSHKDEEYRAELENHLSMLKRNGRIDAWSDRKILPGENINGEIDSRLEESKIVLFLVSPDFITSDYCVDIEVARAIAKHEKNEATVIPVIVRACDWRDSPLGDLKALPNDGKPIKIWGDHDVAWLDVISGLKTVIKKYENNSGELFLKQEEIWSDIVSDEYRKWLSDTEIKLSHRRTEKVELDDIYVCPDVKKIEVDIDNLAKSFSCDFVFASPGYYLFFGDEQAGKTSLAKYFIKNYLLRGFKPIYLEGGEIKNTNLDKIVKSKYKKMYGNDGWDEFEKSSNKVLIVDDYSDIPLNRKHQNIFLEKAKKQFDCIVAFVIDSYKYVSAEVTELDVFDDYEILLFGNVKRAELIEKWESLGVREQIDENLLYEKSDATKIHVDSLVKRNIVPSKPIYLLTILQTFESFAPNKIELTSYGHCYHYLIIQALQAANIKQNEIDSYINFLTELAREIFDNNGDGLTHDELELFFEKYSNKYIRVDKDRVLSELANCSILCDFNGKFNFKYRYIYYFYVAKHLAEQLLKGEKAKETIKELLEYLHKEDCGNIIIFITHHTKDQWVLDEIQYCMMELFSNENEAALNSDELEFMKEFLEEIPNLVLEQREIEEQRRDFNLRQDQSEEIEKRMDEEIEGSEPDELLSKINRVFKGIELIGQIVRNRYGSLEKQDLAQIIEQAYAVGLRFLKYFLGLTENQKAEILKAIEHLLLENPNIDNKELEKEARNIFMLITYGVIYSVIQKVAHSVGSKEASEIYKILEEQNSTPAIKLITEAISLKFNKKIDIKRLKELSSDFKSNIICDRILQEIVIQHCYMHYVEYKDKQKISETLNIPMSSQRLMEKQLRLKSV